VANRYARHTADGPLRRLLDPDQPFCREDVLWTLGLIKRQLADGAPEWSRLDRPQLLAYFSCFAEMSLTLLQRQAPERPETDRFRAMISDLLSRERDQL